MQVANVPVIPMMILLPERGRRWTGRSGRPRQARGADRLRWWRSADIPVHSRMGEKGMPGGNRLVAAVRG
jgi:hypothetical protein